VVPPTRTPTVWHCSFLLEKVDVLNRENTILVADEAKEQQLRAIGMVADMQKWGGGEVPGGTLRTVIDSMHFVCSHASPGVQLADLVAYVIQRASQPPERHPGAQAARDRMSNLVKEHTASWREPQPRARPLPRPRWLFGCRGHVDLTPWQIVDRDSLPAGERTPDSSTDAMPGL